MSKLFTTQDFITKAQMKHGIRYDYSKVNYRNSATKVIIVCQKHGEFSQTPVNHLQMKGCPRCGKKMSSIKGYIGTIKKFSKDGFVKFVNKAKIVHGDKYNYSESSYVNSYTKIQILCHKHQEFIQKPSTHLSGSGCPQCGKERIYNTLRKNIEQFILQANRAHNNKYDYSKTEYVDTKTKVIIICPKHGEFKQSPKHHLSHRGCPICYESHGENKIREFFEQNNIKYVRQVKFKSCRDKLALPFDFATSHINRLVLIEYQGEQHFKPIQFRGMSYEQALHVVKGIKKHNIKLITISYKEFNQIEAILRESLS